MPQLHQGEAREGVLSLDLSALGQRQKETWRERMQRTEMRREQQPVVETREKVRDKEQRKKAAGPRGIPMEVHIPHGVHHGR